jgi:hypothetical protein
VISAAIAWNPLVHLTEGADSSIEAVLACFLNLITKPLNVRHLITFLSPAWCGMLRVKIHSYGTL